MKKNNNSLLCRLGILLLGLSIASATHAQVEPDPVLWWKFLKPGTYAGNNDLGDVTNLQNRIPDYAFFIDPSAFGSGTAADPGKANYKTYPRIVGETGGKDFIVAHKSADRSQSLTALNPLSRI